VSETNTMVGINEESVLDRKRTEIQEIFDAQRKLCHSINNPLTAIMGRAQILQLKQESDPQVIKLVQVVEESAKRVATYVRELSDLIQHGRKLVEKDERR